MSILFVQESKDRKTDGKCYQCSELVFQDHFNKTIQIRCTICREQSCYE